MKMRCTANCARDAVAKGLCLMHYKRVRKIGSTELPVSRRTPLSERFAGKYTVDAVTGCWNWTAALNANGYGAINEGGEGRALSAHRVSYELHVGPVPAGLWVLHRCDNPSCVNPAHLFLGDALANVRDMDAKGRRVSAPRRGPRQNKGQMRRGEKHPQAKLTKEQVRAIRSSTAAGTDIARQFGVAKTTVSSIRLGRTWSNL